MRKTRRSTPRPCLSRLRDGGYSSGPPTRTDERRLGETAGLRIDARGGRTRSGSGTDRRGRGLGRLVRGIEFVDSGTSGGIWGLENGYCLMVGGTEAAVKQCEPIFVALAPDNGYAHVGPSGAGHYVKMVHNGIEYAMLQGSIAAGQHCSRIGTEGETICAW